MVNNSNFYQQSESVIVEQFISRADAISRETAKDKRYISANVAATELLDKLNGTLTDEQREWLAEYEDTIAESEAVLMEHAYRYGVTDGIGMMANERSRVVMG